MFRKRDGKTEIISIKEEKHVLSEHEFGVAKKGKLYLDTTAGPEKITLELPESSVRHLMEEIELCKLNEKNDEIRFRIGSVESRPLFLSERTERILIKSTEFGINIIVV
jgi:hypothetical protein